MGRWLWSGSCECGFYMLEGERERRGRGRGNDGRREVERDCGGLKHGTECGS